MDGLRHRTTCGRQYSKYRKYSGTLTGFLPRSIFVDMKAVKSRSRPAKSSTGSPGDEMTKLERWVDELIQTCERLGKENRMLRAQESDLMVDRERLMEKNELARDRVEAMIMRLKALEKG